MLIVRIRSNALQKIVDYTKKPYEQIGLLIGDFSHDGLWINDVVHGEGDADGSSTVFSPERMARVADDIVNGRLRGKIVGWYHSHLGHGVFMSSIDLNTHLKLHQFHPDVVALVIDSKQNEFGVFTYDHNLGLVSLPEDYIKIV